MFLRVAAVLAIVGLALNVLLIIVRESISSWGFYTPYSSGSGLYWFLRLMSFGYVATLHLPLIIFFVAFLVSWKGRES